MAVLFAFWLVMAASGLLTARLMFRLNRRLQRLKLLGKAPADTPALWGEERGLMSFWWVFSQAAVQLDDEVVKRLVVTLRRMTVAQLFGVLIWFALVASINR